MTKRKIKLLWIAGGGVSLCVALILFMFWSEADQESGTSELLDFSVPDMTLQTVSDQAFPLNTLQGKAVLINFWATWCPPCRQEMPAMQAFQQAYQADGVTVVAINTGETAEKVQPYVDQLDLTFTVLLDPDMQVASAFRVFSVPTSFFVDQYGVVRERYAGTLTYEQMEAKMAFHEPE